MSYSTFLTSDFPMMEIENPHTQLLSVNEALDKGIVLSSLVLDSATIDRDKPGVILWVDSEDNLGEITIKTAEKAWFDNDFGKYYDTDLQHFSSLEWNCTEERANKFFKYIQNHLEKATVLEIWHTWIGWDRNESEKSKKFSVGIGELTPNDLEKLFVRHECDCIVVKVKK